MNFEGLKVVFRTEGTFISAGLELESERAFAVVPIYGPKDTNDVIGKERMELDVLFLQKMNESEYFYKKLVEFPKLSHFGPVIFNLNPESDHDSQRGRLWSDQ